MSPRALVPTPRRVYRWLEMIPGLLVWGTFLMVLFCSWLLPIPTILFGLCFDIYWLIRILYLMTFVIAAFRRYQRTTQVNWHQELQKRPEAAHIWHAIFVPTVAEPEEVLRQTFQALQASAYHPQQTIVVLATEARSPLQPTGLYERIRQSFAPHFAAVLVTTHPDTIPGEVAGKGSNTAWAARAVRSFLDERHIDYGQVVVTTIDADTIIHPQYLSYLTVKYLETPDRTHASYQPIPLFHNNIWEALPWMRIVSYSTTFWLMGDTQRPERLFTFSSHSMPFQALVDVGYWQTDVVSEDSRIFIQCLIHYDGQYRVVPLYLPVSMDAIQAPTWWQSMKNQYKQIRRWAYGAENFPFMIWNFAHSTNMPRSVKWRFLYYQIEGMYSWAVAPLLIVILGWLPFNLHHAAIEGSYIALQAPVVMSWVTLFASIGAISSALLCLRLLPRRPQAIPWWTWLVMALQWVFIPVTMIIFGSIPAIESQTRLLLGRYLGFWVTDKYRLTRAAGR